MNNTFGKAFSMTTFGESHGKALGCIVDGVPVERPSKVPDKISTLSSSFLAVSSLLFPGFLLSSSD